MRPPRFVVSTSNEIKLIYNSHCNAYHTSYLKTMQFPHLTYARVSSVANPTTFHSSPRALHSNEVSLIKTLEYDTSARYPYPTHLQDQIYTHIASTNVPDCESQNSFLSQASIRAQLMLLIHPL